MSSNKRFVAIPLHHLESEVSSYPFASEKAFSLGITELSPTMGTHKYSSKSDRATAALWRDAETTLLHNTPALSVDELINLRDRYWFSTPNGNALSDHNIPLNQYLLRLTQQYLRHRGRDAELIAINTNRQTPAELRWRWRWMSFALPPDLLLGALGVEGTPPTTIQFLNPALETQLFTSTYAEPHLHLNAGYDFKNLWVALINSIGHDGILDQFSSPGAAFKEGKDFGKWLLRAALSRYFIALFLFMRKEKCNFASFIRITTHKLGAKLYDPTLNILLGNTFRELHRGIFTYKTYPDRSLQRIYRLIASPFDKITSYYDFQKFDPIAKLSIFSTGRPNDVTPEMFLTCSAMKYLNDFPNDKFFSGIFWQYQRVRNLFYRHITQRPMTPGLQWFVRFFSRLKQPRKVLSSTVALQSAAQNDGLGFGLSSFEFRIGPDDNKSDALSHFNTLIGTINSLKKIGITHDNPNKSTEFGLIVHFPKLRGKNFERGMPHAFWRNAHADPSTSGNYRYRYGKYYTEQRKSAEILGQIILSHPASLQTLRGIDICTDELGVPTWIFIPIFRYLRECADIASKELRPSPLGSYRLRTTVHAGEDFIHLATGLRHIHEALIFFPLQESDRIGHGMALGVNPEHWAKQTRRVLMTRENRFFDLLWEYHCYANEQLKAEDSRINFVEYELIKEAKIIGLHLKTIHDVLLWYKLLHTEKALKESGFPFTSSSSRVALEIEGAGNPLFWYLTNQHVFQRCKELVSVELEPEINSLISLQNHLKRKLSGIGITIEINPSSNLLIGHLADMENHPLWRLINIDKQHSPNNLPVSIGSDDQITFNTDVRSEYQLLFDCLLRMGTEEVTARNILNRIRRDGLESRFTLPLVSHQTLNLQTLSKEPMKHVKLMP